MTDAYAHVDGNPATHVTLRVPPIGPWFADIVFDAAPDLTGAVTLVIGELSCRGTIDERYNGTRGEQRMCRVVGGANGWHTALAARAYHLDNGVQALMVAQDAAREAGETLGAFAVASATVGIDYVRSTGSASRALEDVIDGAAWWVGLDGVTVVGQRARTVAADDAYELIDYDPRQRLAVLAVERLDGVAIGTTLVQHFDTAQTVREMAIVVEPSSVRVHAWCGETQRSRLVATLESIVDRIMSKKLYGSWRYRVVRQAFDRFELQAINRDAPVPDILPISAMPGIPGASMNVAPGTEVLVEFLEGDRTLPRVTHFAGKDGNGFIPIKLALCDATGTAPFAARIGDSVRITIPAGAVGGTEALPTAPVICTGVITDGSSKVAIG